MDTKDSSKKILPINPSNDSGYLICNKCHGYYQLKNGESPEDFEGCECGNLLEYHKSIENYSESFYEDPYNLDELYEDYDEIEQLFKIIRTKAKKRKDTLKYLYKRIEIQEELLKEIKEERWTLWNVLDERGLQNDIKDQKMLLDEIAEHEDRLMMVIREKRQRNKATNSRNPLRSYIQKIEKMDIQRLSILSFLILLSIIVLVVVIL